jgi:hypothetical protein
MRVRVGHDGFVLLLQRREIMALKQGLAKTYPGNANYRNLIAIAAFPLYFIINRYYSTSILLCTANLVKDLPDEEDYQSESQRQPGRGRGER